MPADTKFDNNILVVFTKQEINMGKKFMGE